MTTTCAFFTGGSLAELLSQQQSQNQLFSENELTQLLLQTAQGLKYIHSQNLVHLDVKPGKLVVPVVVKHYDNLTSLSL